ncbi:MAG: hypothetical protein AAGE59_30420 [Cyanobacteria bacterium P01_F01_bin.86]
MVETSDEPRSLDSVQCCFSHRRNVEQHSPLPKVHTMLARVAIATMGQSRLGRDHPFRVNHYPAASRVST